VGRCPGVGAPAGSRTALGPTEAALVCLGLPGGERSLDHTDIESIHNYRWQTAHSNTVVFNEALVRDTAAPLPEINVFGMNPGVIKTNIMAGVLGQSSLTPRVQQTVIGLLFQSAETYAEKMLPLLVEVFVRVAASINPSGAGRGLPLTLRLDAAHTTC